MPLYRVKPGITHGARNQYKAGDLVEHTSEEAVGFLDKLELVAEAPASVDDDLPFADELDPIDVVSLSIAGVLGAVDEGRITAEKALQQEQGGKQRKTLIAELEKRVNGTEA